MFVEIYFGSPLQKGGRNLFLQAFNTITDTPAIFASYVNRIVTDVVNILKNWGIIELRRYYEQGSSGDNLGERIYIRRESILYIHTNTLHTHIHRITARQLLNFFAVKYLKERHILWFERIKHVQVQQTGKLETRAWINRNRIIHIHRITNSTKVNMGEWLQKSEIKLMCTTNQF